MQKIEIKRFFECLIPVTVCNLKCSYCYVIQRNYRNMELAKFKYTPEHIGKCLTQERLGGRCFFSLCGAGETLAQPETLEIAKELLKNGHIINITTNGTLKNRFKEINDFTLDERERMHFSFSLHYLELKRLNLLDVFFENILLVKELGCSFVVQINLCDEYIPYWDEIKKMCITKLGAPPQVAATRKESHNLNKIEFLTELSNQKYISKGKEFDSHLFEYTIENFNIKRDEFCYAGQRSGTLNLADGTLCKCYADPKPQNIFKNYKEPISFEPIGRNCQSAFCFNSSHFMSLGVIDNNDKRTYCYLRDRPEAGWFNDTMKYALSKKLWDTNSSLDDMEQEKYNKIEKKIVTYYKVRNAVLGPIKRFIGGK